MAGEYRSFLQPDYKKQTPAERRRAQEFAYNMLQSSERDPKNRSWGRPIADILSVIAGQHMLNQTNEGGSQARDEDASNLLDTFPRAIQPGAQAPGMPPVDSKTRMGAIPPFKTEVTPAQDEQETVNNEGQSPFRTSMSTESEPGLDMGGYLKQLAQMESSGGKNVTPNKWGYGGPFGQRTGEHGLTKENWNSDQAHVNAAIEKTKANIKHFKGEYGRDPTTEELYLMHNQGGAGAVAHMNHGDQPAWLNAKRAGKVNDATAKLRISEQISDSSPLKKKPVEQITSDEFSTYLRDKFTGGWKGATKTSGANAGGRMNAGLGGVDPEAGPTMQNTPIPGTTQGVNREALQRYLRSPNISPEERNKVMDRLYKDTDPTSLEHPEGHIEFSRNDPSKQYFRPKEESSEINVDGATVKMKRQGVAPGKWGPWKIDVPEKKDGKKHRDEDIPSVTSPEDAKKRFDKGTVIRLPDGSIGRVP